MIGVSSDDLASHRIFAAEHHLPFPLVADTHEQLAGAFGVGSHIGFEQRVTFVIDRQGRVARVFSPVHIQGHAAEVLAAVHALP